MKKIITVLQLVVFTCFMAQAVPALKLKYKYVQPDGTVLTLQNHGDEYFHWTTDQNGRIVEKAADGFYRTVDPAVHEARRAKGLSALNNARRRAWASYEEHRETNFGDRRVLCIIANFTDSVFVIDNPQQSFSNMLNQEGYNRNGSIGSVRDYYIDNSKGQYRPTFDVFGPVNLSQSSKYYDDHDASAAIIEAYGMLADQINIDDYDTDNDGDIDMILFYYPGRNQAEGAGEESIWPHQSTGNFGTLGGKVFNRYFCTSELFNLPNTTTMCNVGTTCHEFAHSLGIPDFYDTDYEKSGGQNPIPVELDIMSGGNYNDYGRKPPYMNAMELNMLGWMDYPEELSAGSYTLEPIRNYKAYQCQGIVDGEYFIIEARDNYKWDGAIGPGGLMVYHVDKSSRIVGDGMTAAQLWSGNKINAYYGHPCFDFVASGDKKYTFGSSGNAKSISLTDWDDNEIGVTLSNIAYSGDNTSFTAYISSDTIIMGHVYDSYGQPLAGAKVSLSQSQYAFYAAPSFLSGDTVVETDSEGAYSFTVSPSASEYQILTARMDGCVPESMNVIVNRRFTLQDIFLMAIGSDKHTTMQRFDTASGYWSSSWNHEEIAFGIYYSEEELAAAGAVGSKIESVVFAVREVSCDKVYVVIDISDERVLQREVDNFEAGKFVSVDVSDAGICIPSSSDILVGYGFSGNTSCVPWMTPSTSNNSFGTCINVGFLKGSSWGLINWNEGAFFDFTIGFNLSQSVNPSVDYFDVAYIMIKNDMPAAVPQATKTVYNESWFLDGVAVEGPDMLTNIAEGKHTYMVYLSYYDGTEERVYYDFTN